MKTGQVLSKHEPPRHTFPDGLDTCFGVWELVSMIFEVEMTRGVFHEPEGISEVFKVSQ